MTASLNSVLSDPDWLPHACDAAGTNITFVHVPRSARAKLTFLSDEHYKGQFQTQVFPTGEVVAGVSGLKAPLHFIFHSSFASSTLLARALDIPGRIVSLREPDILLHLARMFVATPETESVALLEAVMRLLARPYTDGEVVVVKPSNFANRLLGPILEVSSETRAILLYSDLRTLLRSLVKKGILGRVFGRQLYRNLASWTSLPLDFGPVETFEQTDLQIAGLAWVMHVHQFNEAHRQFGASRVPMLNSAEFIRDPAQTLGRAAGLFGANLDASAIREIAASAVFSSHSKLPVAYTAAQREQDDSAAEAAYGEEIGVVTTWIEAVAGSAVEPLGSVLPPT